MRVCIDIQPAVAQRAGVGRYTKMLVEHLYAGRGMDEFCLFYFDFQRRAVSFPVPGAQLRRCGWAPGRLVHKLWKTCAFPPFDWLAGPADVYHFPNFVRPPLRHGRSVVTIHDVSFLRFPAATEAKNLEFLTAQIARTVQHADAILTDSRFSGQEIQALLKVPESRVFPIHLGLAESLRPPAPDVLPAMRKQLGLERPYLLFVGTLEPRKNIPFLIDVFDRLALPEIDLVLAGMRGWKYEPILARMQRSARAAQIHYLEYVDDYLLPGLYAGAELFVFPTLYEGFGFTPLEAMACGTPVIAARAGSLPEVLGEAAVLMADYEVDAWVARIRQLLIDSARRTRMIALGKQQAARYRWEQTAMATWQVYRTVAR